MGSPGVLINNLAMSSPANLASAANISLSRPIVNPKLLRAELNQLSQTLDNLGWNTANIDKVLSSDTPLNLQKEQLMQALASIDAEVLRDAYNDLQSNQTANFSKKFRTGNEVVAKAREVINTNIEPRDSEVVVALKSNDFDYVATAKALDMKITPLLFRAIQLQNKGRIPERTLNPEQRDAVLRQKAIEDAPEIFERLDNGRGITGGFEDNIQSGRHSGLNGWLFTWPNQKLSNDRHHLIAQKNNINIWLTPSQESKDRFVLRIGEQKFLGFEIMKSQSSDFRINITDINLELLSSKNILVLDLFILWLYSYAKENMYDSIEVSGIINTQKHVANALDRLFKLVRIPYLPSWTTEFFEETLY